MEKKLKKFVRKTWKFIFYIKKTYSISNVRNVK